MGAWPEIPSSTGVSLMAIVFIGMNPQLTVHLLHIIVSLSLSHDQSHIAWKWGGEQESMAVHGIIPS